MVIINHLKKIVLPEPALMLLNAGFLFLPSAQFTFIVFLHLGFTVFLSPKKRQHIWMSKICVSNRHDCYANYNYRKITHIPPLKIKSLTQPSLLKSFLHKPHSTWRNRMNEQTKIELLKIAAQLTTASSSGKTSTDIKKTFETFAFYLCKNIDELGKVEIISKTSS